MHITKKFVYAALATSFATTISYIGTDKIFHPNKEKQDRQYSIEGSAAALLVLGSSIAISVRARKREYSPAPENK